MIKEFIIRIDDTKHEKKLERACKKLCKEFDGEFLTRWIDKKYKPGMLMFMPKNKDKLLYWESRGK